MTESTEGSRYRLVIAGSLLLLNISMGMSFLSPAPLFPRIIEAFDIDRATASLLVGASSLVIALILVPASIVAAKIGPRMALFLGGALISMVALAPLVNSFPLLLSTRLLFALGAALTLAATPMVVMRWFPVREFPVINGLNVFGQSFGVMTSMFLGPRIAAAFDWSGALFAFGCVAMTGTVLWLLVGRNAQVSAETAPPAFALRDIPNALRDRATLLLALGVSGALGTYITFSSWLPTYYTEEFGYSLAKAGSMTALLAFSGILGALMGSTLPARFPKRRPFLIAAGVLLPIAGYGAFMSDSPFILYPSLVSFGILGWIFMPVVFTIPMELPHMTSERVGVAIAVILSAGNLSGFVAPLFVGFLRDRTGDFGIGLSIIALAAFALALSGLLMPETGGRRPTGSGTGEPGIEQAEPAARPS